MRNIYVDVFVMYVWLHKTRRWVFVTYCSALHNTTGVRLFDLRLSENQCACTHTLSDETADALLVDETPNGLKLRISF